MFQLVRKFQALIDMNVGDYWNRKTDKVHRVYKDLPPKAVEELGRMLVDGYKTFVVLVLKAERQEARQVEEAKTLLRDGFFGIPSSQGTQKEP